MLCGYGLKEIPLVSVLKGYLDESAGVGLSSILLACQQAAHAVGQKVAEVCHADLPDPFCGPGQIDFYDHCTGGFKGTDDLVNLCSHAAFYRVVAQGR